MPPAHIEKGGGLVEAIKAKAVWATLKNYYASDKESGKWLLFLLMPAVVFVAAIAATAFVDWGRSLTHILLETAAVYLVGAFAVFITYYQRAKQHEWENSTADAYAPGTQAANPVAPGLGLPEPTLLPNPVFVEPHIDLGEVDGDNVDFGADRDNLSNSVKTS